MAIVDPGTNPSAICSCTARCPTGATSEHCSGWTFRWSWTATATDIYVPRITSSTICNASRWCNTSSCVFRNVSCYLKVQVGNS